MTTPGGVPNLPQGALTLDTLASSLQDTSGTAMKSRAVARFPSIMDSSTGLSPASDLTPFGILTRIWAEINSSIANADPADIQGPEDLPELFLEFIEGLPVIGQFVGILEAILGTYDGDDATLLTIQQFFSTLRTLLAGFNPLDPDFDPLNAWMKIWQLLIRPGGLAVSASDVVGHTLPLTIPFTVGAETGSPVRQWFMDIPQAIRDVLQMIINAFLRGDPTGLLGPFAASFLEAFGFLSGSASRVNTLVSKVTSIEAQLRGGGGIVETLDGPDESSLSGVIHLNYGPATQGSIGRRANGLVFHAGITTLDQSEVVIFPGNRLGSPIQKRVDLLRQRVNTQGDCRYWPALRNNSTTDRTLFDGAYYAIDGAKVVFGYQLNGISHDLTSVETGGLLAPVNYTSEDLELWEFQLGDPNFDEITDPTEHFWTWQVWRNDKPILPEGGVVFDLVAFDPAAAVLLDADHDYRTAAMTADGSFFFQVPPTEVETITHDVPVAA